MGNNMMNLMRRQYKDAIWPDMKRDFEGVVSPIMAFCPELDPTCSREGTDRWKEWSSATDRFRAKRIIGADHMGILRPQKVDGQDECVMISTILQDMEKLM